MARLTLLTFCLGFLFALDSVISWGDSGTSLETSNNIPSSDDNIQIPNQIDRIIEDNGNVIAYVQSNPSYSSFGSYFPYFKPRIATPSARVTITYTLGRRISGKEQLKQRRSDLSMGIFILILGDRLVSSGSQNQQWNFRQNVTQSLIYPRTGSGAVITYVEIVVDQVG